MCIACIPLALTCILFSSLVFLFIPWQGDGQSAILFLYDFAPWLHALHSKLYPRYNHMCYRGQPVVICITIVKMAQGGGRFLALHTYTVELVHMVQS